MTELRWILLAAGVALIAGLYLWGVRARRRSVSLEPERSTRLEPLRTAPPATAPRVEPSVWSDDDPAAEPDALPRIDVDADAPPARPSRLVARHEPRFEPVAAAEPEPEPEPEAPPAPEPAKRGPVPPQKIVAVRVASRPPTMFAGSELREAILAEGFEFGRYDIFHRLDANGRPLCSLASLREPGTFDPDAMAGTEYRGVALFTVLPGPLPSQLALDELIGTARLLAERLGGILQDDRGAALSLQRIGHLREEVAEFERSRVQPPGR